MSRGHNGKGNGHRRKKDDWKNIANSRDNKDRISRTVDPLMCAPTIGETGSAAYRRLRKGK